MTSDELAKICLDHPGFKVLTKQFWRIDVKDDIRQYQSVELEKGSVWIDIHYKTIMILA